MQIAKVTVITSAILGIAAVGALVGFKADRPAWASELMVVQLIAEDAKRLAVSQALRLNDIRSNENAWAIQTYLKTGDPVPPYLRELEADLKRERRDLDDAWKKITQ